MTPRTPPANIEAEAVTLGSMMLGGPDVIREVRDILRLLDFYRPAHGWIFEAIGAMSDAGQPVDLVTLPASLRADDSLDKIGGVQYLVTLAEGTPSATNAAYYARIVKDKSILRGLITAAGQIAEAAYDPGANGADALREAEQRLYELLPSSGAGRTVSAAEAASDVLTMAERVFRGECPGALSLGWPRLDGVTGGGLHPGQLVIIAASTSVGKTSIGLRFALNVAKDAKAVRIFSAEMTNAEVALRLLSMETSINSLRIAPGRLNPTEWDKLRAAQRMLATTGRLLELTDRPLTVPAMAAELRRAGSRLGRPVDLAVIDYCQIIPAHEGSTLREKITAISRTCKLMAKELQIPVLLLSQLSRSSQNERRKPELHDLKESSSIEQDADGVILLHRDPNAEPDPISGNYTVDAKIAKWRNGMATRWGDLPLRFLADVADFSLT